MYNCWNSLPTSVVGYIYKYFLLGDHGDIKTGSTYKIGWGNVEFGSICAYFGVGTYYPTLLGILENLCVPVGFTSLLSCMFTG